MKILFCLLVVLVFISCRINRDLVDDSDSDRQWELFGDFIVRRKCFNDINLTAFYETKSAKIYFDLTDYLKELNDYIRQYSERASPMDSEDSLKLKPFLLIKQEIFSAKDTFRLNSIAELNTIEDKNWNAYDEHLSPKVFIIYQMAHRKVAILDISKNEWQEDFLHKSVNRNNQFYLSGSTKFYQYRFEKIRVKF